MRRQRVGRSLVVVAALLGTFACGGEDSHVPPSAQEAIAQVDTALEEGDSVEICQTFGTLQNELGEWQAISRGNFPPLIQRSQDKLGGIAGACYGMQVAVDGPPADLDTDALTESFGGWKHELRSWSRVKSNWGTLFLWIGGPMIIMGVLLFIKRKFAP